MGRFWSSMSNPIRWAFVLAVALVGYLVLIEPVLGWTADAQERCESLESKIDAARSLQQQADDDKRTISIGSTRFGEVEAPGAVRDLRELEFSNLIDRVLEDAGVRVYQNDPRTVPLSRGPVADEFAAGGRSVYRLMRELRFDADPETATRIIRALEREPLVSGIDMVSMRKSAADEGSRRELTVELIVGTWVMDRRIGRG